jgi:hypothetical protein
MDYLKPFVSEFNKLKTRIKIAKEKLEKHKPSNIN